MEPEPFQISRVFSQLQLPANLRWNRRFRQNRLLHRLAALHERFCTWVTLSRWFKGVGTFKYTRNGITRTVSFNGRNAQFHALYDPQYRYGYEVETAWLLTRLCRGEKNFYDVGANWGYFSLLLAASPDFAGHCYAFEPNPSSFADLDSVIVQAGVQDKVHARQIGLGATRASLHITQANRFLSGLARLSSEGQGPLIPVEPLDELDLPPPNVIKIDAEGMELAIFQGASRLLKMVRPVLVFENFLNPQNPESTLAPIELLLACGYQVFNPTLAIVRHGRTFLASYGTPLGDLLANSKPPVICLVPITPANRFLMHWQLNLVACHSESLTGLLSDDVILGPIPGA